MKLHTLWLMCFVLVFASCADSKKELANQDNDPASEAAQPSHASHDGHQSVAQNQQPHKTGHVDHGGHTQHERHADHSPKNNQHNGQVRHDGHADKNEHGQARKHSEHSPHAGHSKPKPHESHGSKSHGESEKHAAHKTEHHAEASQLEAELAKADAATIFNRRILPILKSDKSSSCTECHFAGVELRDFIADDQAKTFASLKSTGMINVDKPDDSKLLKFIGRKPKKPNRLLAKVRTQQLAAFLASRVPLATVVVGLLYDSRGGWHFWTRAASMP